MKIVTQDRFFITYAPPMVCTDRQCKLVLPQCPADPTHLPFCAGSYKACENLYKYEFAREVSLDPLSMTVMTPYEVRAPPKLWWRTEENSLYTLLFYDVGYFAVKAMYINIPGSNFTQGEVGTWLSE